MSNPAIRLPASAERELIVIARRNAGLRATLEGLKSATGANVKNLAGFLSSKALALRPLFGISEERLKLKAASLAAMIGKQLPDLSVYYSIKALDDELEALAARLRVDPSVEAAFVKPAAELPLFREVAPVFAPPPPATGNFTPDQGYLRPAPDGLDVEFAWTKEGGRGRDVKIIDIEYAWNFLHEDLNQNQSGVIAGSPPTADQRARNHGTAVLGIFSGDQNEFGITGICPEANVRAISVAGNTPEGWGTAAAIRVATDKLDRGDILLIELHRPGPRFNFEERLDQRGYIPIEWWPGDFEAIQEATSRGIIVVEAGGNGRENLDDPLYDINPTIDGTTMFPGAWRNPFRRFELADSGAIVVGAGAPPFMTHNVNQGPGSSRLRFSNFGAIMDAQGWGAEVTTCGLGDLQGGPDEGFWYTKQFNGTSSAAPMVVGVLGCLQGILKAAGRTPLDPATARNLLRTTGTPQTNGLAGPATERIGNLPDLRALIEQLEL